MLSVKGGVGGGGGNIKRYTGEVTIDIYGSIPTITNPANSKNIEINIFSELFGGNENSLKFYHYSNLAKCGIIGLYDNTNNNYAFYCKVGLAKIFPEISVASIKFPSCTYQANMKYYWEIICYE